MARNPHLDRMRSEIESFNDNPREQFIAGKGIGQFARQADRFEPQAISEKWVDTPEHYGPNFRTREPADRFDYGYGQMMNPQGGARQVGRWLTDSDAFNPDVFERQAASSSYPGAAKNYAQWINKEDVGTLESPRQLRDVMGFINEFDSMDPMYRDIYSDEFPEYTPEMYTSKREQIEDEENSFVANLMDMYGRDNPYLQELGGTTTTTDPYGETTEEYTDLGYEYRDPEELAALMKVANRKALYDESLYPYGGASIGDMSMGEREALYDESLMPTFQDWFQKYRVKNGYKGF